MNNKKNLVRILATSAVLAGCNYTPKNETYNQSESSKGYNSETTVKEKIDYSETLQESWNNAWKEQNLNRAAEILGK